MADMTCFTVPMEGYWETQSLDVPKNQKEVAGSKMKDSYGWVGNLMFLDELRKKIMTFRDIIDLPPCNGSQPIKELLMMTAEELHRLYPQVVPSVPISDTNEISLQQGLAHFYKALKAVGDSWVKNHKCLIKFECKKIGEVEKIDSEEFGEKVLEKLDYMIKMAMELFDVMEEEDKKSDKSPRASRFGEFLSPSFPSNDGSICYSPVTPTSVLPESSDSSVTDFPYSPTLFLPLRTQSVGKLKPIDLKRLAFHFFPHVSANGSNTMNKRSKTNKESESEIQEVKSNYMAKPATMEESVDCNAAYETQRITVSSSNQIGGNPVHPRSVAASESPVHSPQTKAAMLLPNVSPTTPPPPPPPPAKSKPNVSSAAVAPTPQTQVTLLPNVSTPPSPPPPPKFLPNVSPAIASPPPPPPQPPALPKYVTMPPPPPPPLPIPQSKTLPQNLSVKPPPPPATLPPNATATSAPTPPLPPMLPSKGSVPLPPPPFPLKNGAAPPPPPIGGTKALGPKKANTKLKRSSFMGNLYRVLKGKVEGHSIDGKSSHGRKTQIGSSAGGKQGMADALAEIAKRSSYFQQIEEDVKKHEASIMELKKAISSFETKDMVELLKFHQYVEHHLEDLTDETQVLARFEDFPSRKLETLRMAATLYTRLNAMVTTLENWKIADSPCQLLDRVERYFNKIKVELDALERNKDDESKKFKSCNIHFDFDILVRIKELMVDVSSGCMELALKERREAKAAANEENGSKTHARLKACIMMLWRAFQLQFRVYTFAGGQDDRADRLSRELAQEIEIDPPC